MVGPGQAVHQAVSTLNPNRGSFMLRTIRGLMRRNRPIHIDVLTDEEELELERRGLLKPLYEDLEEDLASTVAENLMFRMELADKDAELASLRHLYDRKVKGYELLLSRIQGLKEEVLSLTSDLSEERRMKASMNEALRAEKELPLQIARLQQEQQAIFKKTLRDWGL